jgi:hypothetical protein
MQTFGLIADKVATEYDLWRGSDVHHVSPYITC